MSEKRKSAGKFDLVVWADGWPVTTEITHGQNPQDGLLRLHGIEELHDLRYVVDRALALLTTTPKQEA